MAKIVPQEPNVWVTMGLPAPPKSDDIEDYRAWIHRCIAEIHRKHKRAMDIDMQPFIEMLAELPPKPKLMDKQFVDHFLRNGKDS